MDYKVYGEMMTRLADHYQELKELPFFKDLPITDEFRGDFYADICRLIPKKVDLAEKCPNCSADVSDTYFCPECGQTLIREYE